MRTILILITAFYSFTVFGVYAQQDAGVRLLPDQGALYNHTTELKNPYAFPLLGKRLGAKGFLLPYPIGIMVNGNMSSQDVTISDLAIGLNDNPMISLDDVVGFSKVSAHVQDINFRGDLWILPFLDVYGILGKTWVQTDVGIGSIMNKSVNYNTEADFNGYVYGVGAMLTGGVRSMFFSLDVSKLWSHLDGIEHNNSVVNLGLRTGYVFHFQENPEKNISLWTGLTRLYMSSSTVGTVDLSEVLPDFGTNYQNSDWYQELGPQKQAFVDELVQKAEDNLAGDEIHYSLKKRPAKNWSMILGAQYQLSRHWQFRVETNFLGSRTSGLISANYRFGLFPGKK